MIACDIERDLFPFDAESVDLVVANQVSEHVKDIFWVLHESSRVLRVGGGLVIGVPNLASFHNRVLLTIGRQPTSLANWFAHVRATRGAMSSRRSTSHFPAGTGSSMREVPTSIRCRERLHGSRRIWPGAAWALFGRFEKSLPYDGAYLRWPVDQQLETSFYLGPGERSREIATGA